MKTLSIIVVALFFSFLLFPPPTFASSFTVVINEVSWMGTNASTYDEWIELYNNSDSDIDLTGWSLIADDGTPTITFSFAINKTITSKGYYLLERTDDTTVDSIPFDVGYTGALGNSGEHLILKNDSGDTVDEVDCFGRWFAGNNTSKNTMERVDPEKSGSESSNWATNNGLITNGLDAGGNPIGGTPKAQNSVYLVGATITTISSARKLDEDTEVTVVGCVTAPVDVLGVDVFYLQDNTAGVRVKYSDDLPQNYRKNQLQVTGEVRKAWEEIYIKAGSVGSLEADCKKTNSKRVDTNEVGEEYEGLLVDLEGEVVETSGDTFWVDDGTEKAKIYIREETGVEKPYTRVGYGAKIKGIVSQWGEDNYRVLVYEQSGVEITPPDVPDIPDTPPYTGEVLGAAFIGGPATDFDELVQLPVTGAVNNSWMLGVAGLCLGLAGRLEGHFLCAKLVRVINGKKSPPKLI